ncbi:hypothetical protein [Fictibacillus sp. KU28468]|uniref:hypothetical protein n=1 Tax=Fictibacillus sp. KU28468 TaxID=2991053 RepID=UPI00223DBB71|nr:hypothetical protein [Fictibacillus sp. KU28468]UZJ79576.1 hypothetical protein OKX00_03585 [Fictibacillus sp. KU28468]
MSSSASSTVFSEVTSNSYFATSVPKSVAVTAIDFVNTTLPVVSLNSTVTVVEPLIAFKAGLEIVTVPSAATVASATRVLPDLTLKLLQRQYH